MTDAMRAHYRALLAPIYRWMLGDEGAALARSRAELATLGIGRARSGARALDLGAGTGLQSVPLSELGYAVTALDTSAQLLAELRAACPSARAIAGDLADLDQLSSGEFEVIVCMGDTLTHLPSKAAVERVLAAACTKLAPGGSLVLTFRDYASRSLEGDDRFILVRSDDARILTCLLEYDAETVRVTDILHERGDTGWTLRKSSYPKLRLALEWICARLEERGCVVTKASCELGKISIVAASAR